MECNGPYRKDSDKRRVDPDMSCSNTADTNLVVFGETLYVPARPIRPKSFRAVSKARFQMEDQ